MMMPEDIRKALPGDFDLCKYYYIDNNAAGEDYTRRCITVCLIKQHERVSRGIAICSEKENFNTKRGRDKAFGRARKALYRNKAFGHISRDEAIDMLIACGCENDFAYKAYINPIPTTFEEKLLAKR